MPKVPETLLDKFARLYHDRNVARKKFARIDKPKFQGTDMDKHRKWVAAADELIQAEEDLMKAKVKRYDEMAPMPPYYRERWDAAQKKYVASEPRGMTRLRWNEDSPMMYNHTSYYDDPVGSMKMVGEASSVIKTPDGKIYYPSEFEKRGRQTVWYASSDHPYCGTPGRDRFELNYMGDLSPFWINARYPDKWNVPAKYKAVADEAVARYLSAHRAADAIQRDVDMYREWHNPYHLYQGPRRDDIRFKDEKGIEHTPVYDPFHMASPYYRQPLSDDDYRLLTNGL